MLGTRFPYLVSILLKCGSSLDAKTAIVHCANRANSVNQADGKCPKPGVGGYLTSHLQQPFIMKHGRVSQKGPGMDYAEKEWHLAHQSTKNTEQPGQRAINPAHTQAKQKRRTT